MLDVPTWLKGLVPETSNGIPKYAATSSNPKTNIHSNLDVKKTYCALYREVSYSDRVKKPGSYFYFLPAAVTLCL